MDMSRDHRPIPSYSVGWIDANGAFEIVGAFNNNLERLAPADFDALVRRFAGALMDTPTKDSRQVVVLARQDAHDVVVLDHDETNKVHP